VSCEAERSIVIPGDTVSLRAIASDPDGDTLTYAWTCGTGRITGTGPNARLDTSGLAPSSSITAVVRVSDGRGETAEAPCPIRLAAAQRQVETMTCDSAGFPPNLARLNNVDKACLDDVASRLRQDPRSRVVVVGHADAAELRPAVVARQRAEAALSYLVGERGITPSRVSVRYAEATKPRATSRANRRVEVVFVPDGAVAPE
jgi:outer membrane protein OmpA-like peptidoglycan-associated protein